ncbi:MAG: S8/S53 family peptidase [Pseudonocardiales bacterium]
MDAPVEPTQGSSERPDPPRAPLGREPLLAPSAEVLVRYNARVLDPSTAVRVPGQPPIRPTVYIGDRLIVSGMATDATRGTLADAAKRNGLQIVLDKDSSHLRTAELARRVGFQDDPTLFSHAVRLVPAGGGPAEPPDAWLVLQTFRALVGRGAAAAQQQVALDHLLTATTGADIGGSPYTSPHGVGGVPYTSPHGVGDASAQYGMPGWGGRTPVQWVGLEPYRRDDKEMTCRRPVVAVLDTGVGSHPWLGPTIVRRDASAAGVPMGIQDPATDPEVAGVIDDPYEGVLDSDAGHGTFIAGLIRQVCPDADILAIRVMPSDGVVAESDLLDALKLLVIRQNLARATPDASQVIDVVSLSLGYYHEQPDDITFDPQLLSPLRALSRSGVAVVASAGNDSTGRPAYPAAFTPYPGGQIPAFDANCVPLISVGALNPDGTIALFSNAGPWVACHRPGAALVSTFPVTFNASAESSYRAFVPGEGWRETIDPDDFRSGFGTWSGTSFAAPVLAGELAQCLLELEGKFGAVAAADWAGAVERAWNAITMRVKVDRP